MSYEVKKDWITEAGFRAVVIMTDIGHHCGYVGLPEGHPLYGVGYGDETDKLKPLDDDEPIGSRGVMSVFCAALAGGFKTSPEDVFNVHGSLTYAHNNPMYPVPSNDLWWFGYDCGHSGDARSPEYIALKPEADRWLYEEQHSTFKDLDYCVRECESLARQIVERTVTQ